MSQYTDFIMSDLGFVFVFDLLLNASATVRAYRGGDHNEYEIRSAGYTPRGHTTLLLHDNW